ncbi:MAG: glycosyltransferase [Saprospiraceae bacterium]|nr:glycosyltransferase [Saprospiraceae bacterium]
MQLSIIIPTLNEAEYLPLTVQTIRQKAHSISNLEIIVIDAGSSDQTVAIAKKMELITYPRPDFLHKKYLSLNYGWRQATADYILFLDADTLLPKHFDQRIKKCMDNPAVVGGAFEFALNDSRWPFRLITFINRLRYRLVPIFHSDQALFCRKATLEQLNGFPPEPLMETAFVSRMLRKKGKLMLVPSPAVTATRRFKENGIWRVIRFDTYMWMRFVLRLPVASFAKHYWK